MQKSCLKTIVLGQLPFLDPVSGHRWRMPGTIRSSNVLRNLHHVFRLRPFRSVSHFELNLLTLDQGFIAVASDGAVVDKDILLSGLLNKTIAFRVVEPFDLTDRFHHFANPPANFKTSQILPQVSMKTPGANKKTALHACPSSGSSGCS